MAIFIGERMHSAGVGLVIEYFRDELDELTDEKK